MFTRNLISFSFVPGWFLVLFLFGNVVTELSEIDDLAHRRVGRRRDLDQVEPQTLSFAQGVGQLHDAELFAGGSQDDPDFAGANPTVYTNLWLQIKSKLQAGETGSEPSRRIYFHRIFPGVIADARNTSASPWLRTSR